MPTENSAINLNFMEARFNLAGGSTTDGDYTRKANYYDQEMNNNNDGGGLYPRDQQN